MAPLAESLKQELLQAQKTRDGFMKWKVLLVTGTGAGALGFSANPALPHAELALCIIPLACVYVDLLCRNLSIRTKLLSSFMAAENANHPSDLTLRFESYYQEFNSRRKESIKHSTPALSVALEGLALRYSTRTISAAIIPVGAIIALLGDSTSWGKIVEILLFVSAGGAGLFLSRWVERIYQRQQDEISRLATESYAALELDASQRPTLPRA